MKKLKKLSLKKRKIANINTLYLLRGGETETCMSTVCNTDMCETGYSETYCPTYCDTTDDTSVNHTTLHTNANSVGCMSGDNNNNNGSPQQSVEIC